MALNLAVVNAGDSVPVAGILLPLNAFPGITQAELTDQNRSFFESKFVLSYLLKVYSYISSLSSADKPLSLSVTKANPTGVGDDLINQNFSTTFIYLADLENGLISSIPAFRSLNLNDLFPGVSYPQAGNAAETTGILLPGQELSNFGLGFDYATGIVSDHALALAGMNHYIMSRSTRRSANDASAVINYNRGNTTGFTPPANFTTGANPLTRLTADKMDRYAFFSITSSITVQLKLDQQNQTFDANTVTA